VNGVRTVELGFANTTISPFKEHTFKINVTGNIIEVYVDDMKYIRVEDSLDKSGAVKVSAPFNIIFITKAQQLNTPESSELCAA